MPISVVFANEKYIAIIIDDFGNGTDDVDAMIALEIPFTGAVIPGQPHSVEHMEKLIEAGKDVIIHLPMEAPKAGWQSKLAISGGLNSDQIRERVEKSIEELTQAYGLNNHMGSVATANKKVMTEVIQVVKENDLLMIDSVTTSKSKMKEVCKELEVPFIKRDVFLDRTAKHDTAFVEKRMKELAKVADKKGYAVGIGHVGTAGGLDTVAGIKNMIPVLQEQGYVFVTISQLHTILK